MNNVSIHVLGKQCLLVLVLLNHTVCGMCHIFYVDHSWTYHSTLLFATHKPIIIPLGSNEFMFSILVNSFQELSRILSHSQH